MRGAAAPVNPLRAGDVPAADQHAEERAYEQQHHEA
jgi:hypothetical protein